LIIDEPQAIELMTLLSPVADLLSRMPASTVEATVNAGLSFATARSRARHQQGAIWPLLVERARDLATSFEGAAKEVDESLSSTADRLFHLANRIEAASPVLASKSVPLAAAAVPTMLTPPIAEVPVATAASTPIEEVRVALCFSASRGSGAYTRGTAF
jgi:hypothetical protein